MVLQSLTVGGARFRTGRWRGRPELAYLVPLSAAHTLGTDTLTEARTRLRARGFTEVVTAAVPPPERDAFLRDEFVDHERLHLLRFDLRALDRRHLWRIDRRIRRARPADWPSLLEVDALAFDEFWRLDTEGLQDALAATPRNRLRVIRDRTGPRAIAAYAAAGRAGTQGYLQRLAVDPDHEGEGLGTTLVDDALRWMRRRGADVAWVNTQERNERAMRLYQHLGFELQPDPLTVLRRSLA
jgi:ribosomal protein S18 acetylase RimI-like enzyme